MFGGASPLDIPSLIAGPRRAQKLSVINLELGCLFLPALRPRDMAFVCVCKLNVPMVCFGRDTARSPTEPAYSIAVHQAIIFPPRRVFAFALKKRSTFYLGAAVT